MLTLVEPSPSPCVDPVASGLDRRELPFGQPGTRLTRALDRGGRHGQKRRPGANERHEPASPGAAQGGDRRSDGQSPAGQAGPRRSRPRPAARALGAPQGRSAPLEVPLGGTPGPRRFERTQPLSKWSICRFRRFAGWIPRSGDDRRRDSPREPKPRRSYSSLGTQPTSPRCLRWQQRRSRRPALPIAQPARPVSRGRERAHAPRVLDPVGSSVWLDLSRRLLLGDSASAALLRTD